MLQTCVGCIFLVVFIWSVWSRLRVRRVKPALLRGLLAGPLFGPDLVRGMKNTTGGMMRLSRFVLHCALAELEDEGLVAGHEEELPSDSRRLPQRCYRLTAAGRRRLLKAGGR